MLDPAKQRAFAVEVVEKLRAEGHAAYWAGGCVRDWLLGLVPKDYDVATNAEPDKVRDLFGRRRTLPIGAAFGVIAVLGPKGAGQIEVATFRRDAQYSDGRHPDHVTFSSPEEDAQRRDFTINGLFYDPHQEQVIDFVGGQADLSSRTVRAIGDPRHRFAEDKLRMLRAVRFTAAYEFSLDPATLQAVQEMAAELSVVSAERIGGELARMLVHPTRQRAFELLNESTLLGVLLPEVAALNAMQPAAWHDTLRTLNALEAPSLPLALAALLHRAGDATLAERVGRELRYPNKDMERAVWLLNQIERIPGAANAPWPRLQRLLISEGIDELLALAEAMYGANEPGLRHCRGSLALPPEALNPQPLVTGSDLIARGLRPGKHFGELLERIRDAQLDREIETREEAIALAMQLAAEK